MRVQRQHMGDVLVGAHHHQGTQLATDAAQVKNVGPSLEVWAEDLFIVTQTMPALTWPQQLGHGVYAQVGIALLKDGPQVKYGIRVLPGLRELAHGGMR